MPIRINHFFFCFAVFYLYLSYLFGRFILSNKSLDRKFFFHSHVHINEWDFLVQERYSENSNQPHGLNLLSSIKLIVQWSNTGLNSSHSKSKYFIYLSPTILNFIRNPTAWIWFYFIQYYKLFKSRDTFLFIFHIIYCLPDWGL